MGLLSGLTGGSKTNVPASGFYAMPGPYQGLYNSLLGQANTLYGDNAKAAEAFTPTPINEGERAALDKLYAGFAPTEQSLRSDISMFMNPYDDYVINDINREATGQNSLINQAANRAGQQGSNRSFLGTSDVEQQRLNSIGQFRQGQYNTSINNVLNSLIPQRQQDANNAMTAGSFERGIDMGTKQAPYTALSMGQQSLAGFPTSFGDFGSPATTVKSGGGLGGLLGTVGSIASMATGNPIFGIAGNAIGGGMSSGSPSGIFSGIQGLGSNMGLWGGLDPVTGINWNSGRGGGFFGY